MLFVDKIQYFQHQIIDIMPVGYVFRLHLYAIVFWDVDAWFSGHGISTILIAICFISDLFGILIYIRVNVLYEIIGIVNIKLKEIHKKLIYHWKNDEFTLPTLFLITSTIHPAFHNTFHWNLHWVYPFDPVFLLLLDNYHGYFLMRIFGAVCGATACAG